MRIRNDIVCVFIYIFIPDLDAQSWDVLKTGTLYHYERSGSGYSEATIWVDSAVERTTDTVYFLNTIVADCDTCTSYVQGLPEYVNYRSAQFLQRQVRKTDSSYIFDFPEHFTIRHQAALHESWEFDPAVQITARISQMSSMNRPGGIDSIKVITLSTGDTILLSKWNGIIRFDPVYKDERYDRIEGAVPGFRDFFDFSVGDILEYQGESWTVDSWPQIYIKKVEITGKSITGDRIGYDVHVQNYRRQSNIPPEFWYSPEYASSRRYNEKWIFENAPGHPANLFNNDLVRVEDYAEEFHCSDLYQYSRVLVARDSLGSYTKTVGSFETMDFFSEYPEMQDILKRIDHFYYMCDEHEYVYTEGLGITHFENRGFEWSRNEDLVACLTGNDTIGTLTPDEDLVVGMKDHLQGKISVFPNPAGNSIQVIETAGASVFGLTLIDLYGRVVRRSVTDFMDLMGVSDGIYILVVDTNKGTFNKTIVKQ